MIKEKDIPDIVQKYVRGKSTRTDIEEAISLFEDSYHNLALRPVFFELWNTDDLRDVNQPKSEILSNVLNHIHHKIDLEKGNSWNFGTKKLIINILKISAVLIIGLFSGLYINTFKKVDLVYYTSVAPKGSISQMILPDNSMAYLNSGSELKYLINGNSEYREVILNGEAWFQVTKNEEMPFIVHTPYYDVNVIGTEFNVKAYESDLNIETTLEKGSVLITSSDKIKLAENVRLKPGEQLHFNKETNTIRVTNVDTRIFTSWKDNKLIFINMNLKELKVLLERKYGVKIDVVDQEILNCHITGTFKNETILEIMDILRYTLPIRYEIDGQKILLYKN